MRNFLFCLLLIGCCQNFAYANRDTIRVGLYIENIYDLDFKEGSYKIAYYIWYAYKNPNLHLPDRIEVFDNKKVETEYTQRDTMGDTYWVQTKIKAEIINDWDIRQFPFDEQNLSLEIELFDSEDGAVVVLDSQDQTVESQIKLPEWTMRNPQFQVRNEDYNTAYRTSRMQKTTYQTVAFSCMLRRKRAGLFLKLFSGVIISVIIALCSLLIPVKEADPRFGLPVGGLFSGLANKYFVENITPQTTYSTLSDKIHFASFCLILLVVITSIVSRKIYDQGRITASRRVDKTTFIGFLILYLLYIVILIL